MPFSFLSLYVLNLLTPSFNGNPSSCLSSFIDGIQFNLIHYPTPHTKLISPCVYNFMSISYSYLVCRTSISLHENLIRNSFFAFAISISKNILTFHHLMIGSLRKKKNFYAHIISLLKNRPLPKTNYFIGPLTESQI